MARSTGRRRMPRQYPQGHAGCLVLVIAALACMLVVALL